MVAVKLNCYLKLDLEFKCLRYLTVSLGNHRCLNRRIKRKKKNMRCGKDESGDTGRDDLEGGAVDDEGKSDTRAHET